MQNFNPENMYENMQKRTSYIIYIIKLFANLIFAIAGQTAELNWQIYLEGALKGTSGVD